jgi:hypothetical protein
MKPDWKFWLNWRVVLSCWLPCLLLLGGGVGGCVAFRCSDREEVVTVRSKEVAGRGETPQFLIFTDQGVYESRDALVVGKFDSADVYAKCQPNHTHRVRVIGWRVPFLSWFPNVVEVIDATPVPAAGGP